MDGQNKMYVLEANPNPQLSYGEEFAESAVKKGLAYEAVLQRIVNAGLQSPPERRA